MITITEMAEKIGRLDATHESDATATARFILNNMDGYKGTFRPHDLEFMSVRYEAADGS